eukprot:TRINITY_DN10772_c0_g1_i1.p1 TRINITY_DN10772_c0_g1~~TRINITY_DN10772_c0_g1_i1.p1  ORF type:complete len:133 (+),score=71.12 TRINITY_DN10772_c0_g1_i1:96-494(+)
MVMMKTSVLLLAVVCVMASTVAAQELRLYPTGTSCKKGVNALFKGQELIDLPKSFGMNGRFDDGEMQVQVVPVTDIQLSTQLSDDKETFTLEYRTRSISVEWPNRKVNHCYQIDKGWNMFGPINVQWYQLVV